jgi:hypothetical protein
MRLVLLSETDAEQCSKPTRSPQSWLSIPTRSGRVFDGELTITKNALAWLAVAGYVIYLVSANKVGRKNSTEDKTIERETERFFFPAYAWLLVMFYGLHSCTAILG